MIFRGGSAQILSHLLSLKEKVSDKCKEQETMDKRVDVLFSNKVIARQRGHEIAGIQTVK